MKFYMILILLTYLSYSIAEADVTLSERFKFINDYFIPQIEFLE